MEINVTLNGTQYRCRLNFGKYSSGQTAIELLDTKDGAPIAKATINVPDYKDIPKDFVIIKDYAENTGMYNSLIKAGVIQGTSVWIQTGYANSAVCKLLIPIT